MKTFKDTLNLTGLTPGDFRDVLYFALILAFAGTCYLMFLYFEAKCRRKKYVETMRNARIMRTMMEACQYDNHS